MLTSALFLIDISSCSLDITEQALHAVKQLPSVEAEPTNKALTSNKEIITKRRAISRAALRERLEQIAIAVTVVAICSVQQIITGVINDDASEVNIDSYRARFESSTDLFKTFFDPKEEPDWTYWSPKFGLFYREEFYYAVIMPRFSIPVLYRVSINMTSRTHFVLNMAHKRARNFLQV